MSKLAPSKLTVRILKRKLGDHYLDFMNANNPSGFTPDEDAEINDNTLSGVLMLTALTESLTRDEIKSRARKVCNMTGRKIPLLRSYEYVAEALGYRNWSDAVASEVDGKIVNLRLQQASLRDTALVAHGAVKEGFDLRHYAEQRLPLPEGFESISTPEVIERMVKEWQALQERFHHLSPRAESKYRRLLKEHLSNVKPGGLVAAFESEGHLVYLPWSLYNTMKKWRKRYEASV